MRTCVCLIAFALTIAAQAPPQPVKPDTVIAKAGDLQITAADLDKLLAGTPPVVAQTLRQEPARTIGLILLTHEAAAEAQKLGLDQKSPWKEQIEVATQQILLSAMTSQVADAYQVTPDETEAYYKAHAANYKQVKIKAIKISFKPDVAASPNNLEDAAKRAFEAAHAATDRSEAEAKKIADDVVKQARGGADFQQLVTKYGEGESKDFQGDFPAVKQNGMYSAEIKKTVFAMKPGEISDPIRESNGFYVIRVTEVSAQPLNDVRADIIQTIKTLHVQEYIDGLRARFNTQILRPDYFYQLNAAPAQRH